MVSLLVINPNSSASVSANLEATVTPPQGTTLTFYTAPSSAPAEITGSETSAESEKAVLPDILEKGLLDKFDGFLVACYSDHPLVRSLAKHTSKPVLGIMQATLLYSYGNSRLERSVVVTSTSGWLPLLDEAVVKFAGSGSFPEKKFARSQALDISVLNLSDASEFSAIAARVRRILQESEGPDKTPVDCVLLGCAGMAGLDEKLGEVFPDVVFVDSVKAGVSFLRSLIELGK